MLPIIRKAARIVGNGKPNYSKLAREIGCLRPAMYVWRKTPPEYAIKIEKVTNGKITLSMLRPDLWPSDRTTPYQEPEVHA